MAILRSYDPDRDTMRVSDWLARIHRPEAPLANWLQPRWEYMHFHPLVRDVDLTTIGLWEDADGIVGLVHPEHASGQAYFQCHPERTVPRAEMLAFALDRLIDAAGRLRLFLPATDTELTSLAAQAGLSRSDRQEVMSCLAVPADAPSPQLPERLRLSSLTEENDLAKIDRVFWRGFGHGEEPPGGGEADLAFMQSAPNFRHDLNLVIVSAGGDYVAYAGMWFDAKNRLGYVEPVATDPDFRRRGLARAVVLEGIRRCAALGATAIYVGSDLPLYLALGFEVVARWPVWER